MLLQIEDLTVEYQSERGKILAVDGVSLSVNSGNLLSVVGESGCGKSTLAYSIIRLSPGKVKKGKIIFNGKDLLSLNKKEIRQLRGKDISMVFQDPMTSLDPLEKIGTQMVETILAHEKISKTEALNRVQELLNIVGIPEDRINSYPHQLSGGQRQRIIIAMAISLNPKLLIADEPTTALDVIVQDKILEIFKELTSRNISIILITHDLPLAVERSDFIAVMYAGWLMEFGRAKDVAASPLHPYTQGLIDSVPDLWVDRKIKPLKGFPPDLANPPSGCRFHPRCPKAMEICSRKIPPNVEVNNRMVRCFLYGN
ncbi:oligopeptide/dipeptide ABC transporter, ATPase subunit [Thermodesulfatator indicus DSM 15286]|uniref:Nickel import system ATP-binding protein NikD n=1 Tax=Thermodesulfatator indicus (strain DSM 15286 / JCM 11887 / CIR29812) TaxID=667014 RepID=F8ADI0_THEID|nr:ABC transporter ATP-binding protein [Thermodesulfatator indicus]AEH44854.1 oligopeptide/dipeptide ABC transporter, ATPase subunit [Thermodesulfatator indicus DSM 15286]